MKRLFLILVLMLSAVHADAQVTPEGFNVFVPSLPSATLPLGSGDNVPVIQGGTSKQAPGNQLVPLASSGAAGRAKGDGVALSTSGGVISSNIAIGLPPGLSTTIGTCNGTSQSITVTGTLNSQLCINSVSGTYNVVSADSGRLVKCTSPGCVVVLPNPLAITQGTTYQFTGDGTNGFTVQTTGGAALFLGGPGGGGPTLNVPAAASVTVDVDNTTSPASYAFEMQGVSSTAATNVTQGIMRGDGTTINCSAGVCNAVAAGTTAETFLSTTAASGQVITVTGLTSAYKTYHLNCTGLLVSVSNDQLVGEVEIGASFQNANYLVAAYFQGSGRGAGAAPGGLNNATATDIFSAGFSPTSTTVPANLRLDIDGAGSTTAVKPITWELTGTDGSGNLWIVHGTSYYFGATGAIVGIRLRNSTGSDTLSGQCTLSGRQ